MKIRIHKFLEDYPLSDGQKVFAALLAYAFNCESTRSEFFFHAKDIRIMSGYKNIHSPKSTHMKPFTDNYRIGEWSDTVWSLSLKDIKAQSSYGNIPWIEVEITHPKAVNIYYYIMGRVTPWERGCMDHEGIAAFAEQDKPYTPWLLNLKMNTDAYNV